MQTDFDFKVRRPTIPLRWVGMFFWFGALSLVSSGSASASDEDLMRRGESIYAAQCASCHGGEGQGVDEFYPNALVGDASIGELAELIADTMPEEDPEACVAEDAQAVAAFIHHDFYGEAAQVRRRPPRAVLSRLTGNQLRQSLADLYGRFSGTPWTQNERGVEGIYFNGSRWKNEEKKIERVDPVLDFDFGRESPGEGIEAEAFYIHWSGALKINQTGRYELVARSSCSFKMDFGGRDRELIDNHVQSEGKDEFRRTLYLTAGRCYPFKIEFIQRKRKTEQPPARFSLSWVPPGGVEEIIPAESMIPSGFPSTFALQSKLPPDDRSYGYDRGTAINRSWEESTTAAAIEFAQVAADEVYPQYLRKHKKDDDKNRGKLRGFLTELVETAFRGPLDQQLQSLYIDRQIESCPDDAEAIRQVALMTIKSPRFLYPTLDADRSPSQRAANRLALTLFDSLPSDEWLTKMVQKNQLERSKSLHEAAWKMVSDYRCEAKIRDLIYHWFELSEVEEITKDAESFPGFDQALVADLRKSFEQLVSQTLQSDACDFRQFLQSDRSLTNDRLAAFYGDAWRADGDQPSGADTSVSGAGVSGANDGNAPLVATVSDSARHVGLLTHPLVMSHLAYNESTSPIHRGVFLTRYVLGRVLRPPNEAFAPLNPELHPEFTNRQRVELQTGEVSCQVCHSKINPLGFALENFDAAGRFQETDNGKPVDASGGYLTRAGEAVEFTGARELGDFLAGSPDCHRSFVEAAFEHFVKQPIAAFGPDLADQLTRDFQNSGFNIKQLIVSIAVIAAENPDGPTTTVQ